MDEVTRPTPAAPGRPAVTSHGAIEAAAFRLFARHGFEGTTVAMIAAEAGIGQRTLFRWFPSKNDIAWGRFEESLTQLREALRAVPRDVPVGAAVERAVLTFNRFPADVVGSHRERMRLILTTPALQAHSAVRYADWRRVIEEYVADRLDLAADDLLPVTVGRVALATAVAAYTVWLGRDDVDLERLLADAFADMRHFAGLT